MSNPTENEIENKFASIKLAKNKFSAAAKGRLLPVLINRAVIFLFVMCLLTILLYASGTAQNFIDTTQLALLRFYTGLGILLTIGATAGFFFEVLQLFRMKKARYILGAASYALLLLFGVVTVPVAMFIVVVSGGNL